MIEYGYQQEKIVAHFFADALSDAKATEILERGYVTSADEATHLSKFFWAMIDKSVQGIELPCDGSSEY